MRNADGRVEHAQIIVDFGDGADGGTRTAAGGFLFDGNGRAQAVDGIDVGPLHLIEELARVGRERFDVAALALGVDGVEGERRFADPLNPVMTVKVLRGISTSMFFKIVLPCAMHGDAVEHGTFIFPDWSRALGGLPGDQLYWLSSRRSKRSW